MHIVIILQDFPPLLNLDLTVVMLHQSDSSSKAWQIDNRFMPISIQSENSEVATIQKFEAEVCK